MQANMPSEPTQPAPALPWTTSDFVMNDGNLIIEDNDNTIVALVIPSFFNGVSLQLTHAEFITRACNAHGDLVQALAELADACDLCGAAVVPLRDKIDAARAAVAKATELIDCAWPRPDIEPPMQPQQVHRCVSVTGRIIGQDEDTMLVFENMTTEQACDAYTRQMVERYIANHPDETPPKDDEVAVNIVAVSDAPIVIREHVIF